MNSIIGNWEGKIETYLQPGKLANEGKATSYVRYRLDQGVVEMEYTHEMKDIEHNAILLFTLKDEIQASWIDSYHTVGEIMNLEGTVEENRLIFTGEYPGGDQMWGWRIELFVEEDKLHFLHYNIPPEDVEYLGVKGIFEENVEEDSFLSDYEY